MTLPPPSFLCGKSPSERKEEPVMLEEAAIMSWTLPPEAQEVLCQV